jgi:hypothetical protein
MTASTIEVRGLAGAEPAPPVPGKDAPPLVDGNGKPGVTSKSGCTCKVSATNGHPGNKGGGAPGALKGANGDGAPAVTMHVREFSGSSLSVLVTGGGGGLGMSGGKGGAGGAGGDAGAQPKACVKKYQDSVGGQGGRGGDGGTAGDGGNAGSGGYASLVWDEKLGPDFRASVTCQAGQPGHPGKPGDPGDPGKGGLDGDGKTRAPDGDPAGGGGPGQLGGQGQSGSGTSQSAKGQTDQIELTVVPV